MVAGFVSSFIYIFFINGTNAKALQLSRLIFGKDNIVGGTSFEKLAQIDAVVFCLPIAIIVTGVVWAIYAACRKNDVDEKHVEKCFEGI